MTRKKSSAAAALPPWWGSRLDLLLLTLLLLLLLGYFLRTELTITGGRLGVPLDDAWIHYQFARNLAQGEGFSYNPGQPMPGSTAPLWTLLLAAVGLFTEKFVLPSLLLSAFFLALTVWLVYGFTLQLSGSRWTAVTAAAGVIICGRFLWAGLAGMETTAFAAASVAAVWAYHRQGIRPLPTLLFALAAQLRPEGHALYALALADYLYTNLRPKPPAPRSTLHTPRSSSRSSLLAPRSSLHALLSTLLSLRSTLLTSFILYALISLPYILFSLSITGRPLPNTFYAKAGSQHFFSVRSLREILVYHLQDNYATFFLIPFGLLPAVRRNRLLVAWLLALPLLTAFVVDLIWHHGRYTLPLIPFQMIVAALGAHWLLEKLQNPKSKIQNPKRIGQVFLLLLLILVGGYRLPYWAGMLGHNSNEILEIDVALGEWLAENTPPDALIAVDDIGAITFMAQRPILDLQGLVSPEMWPVNQEAEGQPRQEATTRLLSSLQPDYLAIFPIWHYELATNPAVLTPLHRVRVDTHSIIFDQEAIVYRPHWPYLSEVNPQQSHLATLGDAIQLIGYDLALPADASQPLNLTLYWQSLAAVTESYTVFIHLIGPDGTIIAQADQPPVAGLAPTPRWQPGDLIRDPYQLTLPPNLPAASYRLQAGMYLPETGARLPVGGLEAADNIIPLTTLNWP